MRQEAVRSSLLPRAALALGLAVGVVLGSAGGARAESPTPRQDSLQITFLAVGQADSAVYRGPCGDVGVIDVGARAKYVEAFLRSIGVSSLAWIVVSHYDLDHIRGVVKVGEAFPPDVVYDRGGGANAKKGTNYTTYFTWAEGTGHHIRLDIQASGSIRSGFALCSGEQKVSFRVLSAGADGTAAGGVKVVDENDRSVCLRVAYRLFREFTCGDVSGRNIRKYRDVETKLAPLVGRVDVLKVSHHGSASSSNQTFVDELCPSVSVISVGKNNYKHPNSAVWRRLDRVGDVYETETPRGNVFDGNVTVTTDGRVGMVVTTQRSASTRVFRLARSAHGTTRCGKRGRKAMRTQVISDIWVLIACIAYATAAWLLQMYRVIPPRDWLLQRLKDTHGRIESEGWKAGKPAQDNLEWLQKWIGKPWFRLSTSRVQAGWRNVHGLEDAHLLELSPQEVEQRLREVRDRLAAEEGSEADGLVKRIDQELQDENSDVESRRALLQRAEIFRHNLSDTEYEDLAALLAKAVWLTILALALIAGLAGMFHREAYFLFGAAGALISRLTRILRRRPSASDYGASWSTLILGPAAGALAGWVGVFLASVLAGNSINVLGDRFAAIWNSGFDRLGFLVAFAFGFSERLFDRLLGATVREVGTQIPPKRGGRKGKRRPKPGKPNGRDRGRPPVEAGGETAGTR